MSQTMNPNARRSMPGAPAPGMQLYDAPNCDYEPPKNFQQNFGERPEVTLSQAKYLILAIRQPL